MEPDEYPGIAAWIVKPTVSYVPLDENRPLPSTALASYVHVETGPDVEARINLHGHWVGAHLRTSLTLPSSATMVRFEGAEMLICSATSELLPAIFYRTDRDTTRESQRLIQRFISALNWMNPSFGTTQIEWTIGGRPIRHGNRPTGTTLSHSFYQEWLPQNLEPDQRLALAFFREGNSISHSGYQFLSFYKVINLKYRRGQSQKTWISRNLAAIDEDRAKKRMDELRLEFATDEAIAKYLYVSCRCAVAHAAVDEPTVDPEDPKDQARLRKDLPLIRSLAEHLIRSEFKIPNRTDIWEKNVVTLEGARLLIGQDVYNRLTQKKLVFRSEIKLPRTLDVKVWGKLQLPAFKAMHMHTHYSDNGAVALKLSSKSEVVTIWVLLDFAANKVFFEPLADLQCDDNGSAQAANDIADASQLRREVFGNGMIELWDRESGLCIAQGDAYMPVNMMLDYEKTEAEIRSIREMAIQRQKAEAANPDASA